MYARTLSTSINTSFGTNLQGFISDILVNAYGSLADGLDICFIDKIDREEKHAQLKLDPNTINKDDVKTIHDHFRAAQNRARTNGKRLSHDSLIVSVMYGNKENLNGPYKSLEAEYGYPVMIGKNFWLRLTGEPLFFKKFIHSVAQTLSDVNSSQPLEDTIKTLSQDQENINLANLAKLPSHK